MFLAWWLGPTSCTAKPCFNPGEEEEVLVNCVEPLLVVAAMVAMVKL